MLLPSKKRGLCIFVALERHEICARTACEPRLIRVSPVLETLCCHFQCQMSTSITVFDGESA